jgi:undecaprenyl-diphosphatase
MMESLILLFLIYRAYDWKIALWSLLGVIVVVTIADRASVELFKEVFQRYRPSRNLELYDKVHIVNEYRGGKYGFISSLATNFFGIATFLFLLLRKHFPRIAPWILVWASLIAYTRIYLGVHYPSDIMGGLAVGGTIGFGVYFAFKKFLLDRQQYKPEPSE